MKARHFVGGAWLFIALRLILLSLQPDHKGVEGLILWLEAVVMGGLAIVLIRWDDHK